MTQHTSPSRRTVLSGIVTGAAVAVSGCLSSSDNGDPGDDDDDESEPEDDGIFTDVFVDGAELVLEFSDDASIDQVNVIDPSGELFDEISVATGVDRETLEIGTSYEAGEYELVALEGDEEQVTRTVEIEPDVQITDLRLGRNHPDEMFDDASDIDIRTETIITLENTGTGPDEVVRLSFIGEVPRPTPNDYDESGIYDTDSDIRRDADSVELLPDDEIIIYSQLMPFSSSGQNISCSPDTEEGEFEVEIESTSSEEPILSSYAVLYTGEDLDACEIEVEPKS